MHDGKPRVKRAKAQLGEMMVRLEAVRHDTRPDYIDFAMCTTSVALAEPHHDPTRQPQTKVPSLCSG